MMAKGTGASSLGAILCAVSPQNAIVFSRISVKKVKQFRLGGLCKMKFKMKDTYDKSCVKSIPLLTHNNILYYFPIPLSVNKILKLGAQHSLSIGQFPYVSCLASLMLYTHLQVPTVSSFMVLPELQCPWAFRFASCQQYILCTDPSGTFARLNMPRITSAKMSLLVMVLTCTREVVLGDHQFEEHLELQMSQTDMVQRYVSGHLQHTLVAYNRSSNQYTMGYQLKRLLSQTFDILRNCSAKYACECNEAKCDRLHAEDTMTYRAYNIPCGSIYDRSFGSQNITRIEVPPWFKINVTLLGMDGYRHTNECLATENLIIAEPNKGKRVFCGKRSLENIYTESSQVYVAWYNQIDHGRMAFYCLAYEAISGKRVFLREHNSVEAPPPKEICERRHMNCAEPQSVWVSGAFVPSGGSVFVYGDTWLYTWFLSAHFPLTPILKIISLTCGQHGRSRMPNASDSGIKITDGPFYTHDQQLLANIFRHQVLQDCHSPLSDKTFRGSIGDLTAQGMWKSHQTFEVRMTFSLAQIHCQNAFCSYQEVKVFQREPVSAHTPNSTTHAWLDITYIKPMHSFLVLQDMVYYYDGLGHMPCITGGIFIYEMTNPMSLVTKICTLWSGMIWSKNDKPRAIRNLHFSNQPILIVVKSYRKAGRGYFAGHAQLSPCEGVVNPVFRLTNGLQHNYKQLKLSESSVVGLGKTLLNVKHGIDCVVIQEILVDQTESWDRRWSNEIRFQMSQEHITNRLPFMNVTGCFDLPVTVNPYVNKGFIHMCPQPAVFTKTGLSRDLKPMGSKYPFLEKRGCFQYQQSFSGDGFGLQFSANCLLFGLKISILLHGKSMNDVRCGESHPLQQSINSYTFTPQSPALLPHIQCGSIILPKKLLNYQLLFPRMSIRKSRCCYLEVSVGSNSLPMFTSETVNEVSISET